MAGYLRGPKKVSYNLSPPLSPLPPHPLFTEGTVWRTVADLEADFLAPAEEGGIDLAMVRVAKRLTAMTLEAQESREVNGMAIGDAVTITYDVRSVSLLCLSYIYACIPVVMSL